MNPPLPIFHNDHFSLTENFCIDSVAGETGFRQVIFLYLIATLAVILSNRHRYLRVEWRQQSENLINYQFLSTGRYLWRLSVLATVAQKAKKIGG